MGLPNLSDEERDEALAKAARIRRDRAQLKKDVKEGTVKVSEVIARAKTDPVAGRLRVRALLMSVPGIGESKAQAIMEQVSIAETRRVAGLGKKQAAALIERFG